MFLNQTRLILIASVFLVVFCNITFFQNLTEVFPLVGKNLGFLASAVVALTAVLVLLLNLVRSRYTTKPFLIGLLLVSSCTAYFMDTYNIVIDETMIQNILETNLHESLDLFSLKLVGYFLLLGVIPAVGVLLIRVEYGSKGGELVDRLKAIAISLAIIGLCILPFSRFYTSFFREHKPLRYFTNPTYSLYSLGRFLTRDQGGHVETVQVLGQDARIAAADKDRELIIFVVGEAGRADHFSLNGYSRQTNPLLEKEDVVTLSDISSCGTSTAVSVPCMFSVYNRQDYNDGKGKNVENVLDVMQHAGVNVLWRENNSNSKKVAARIPYEEYRNAPKNTLCDDGECRDEGMLVGLQDYVDSRQKGDVFIVLHQMGSHGPAYYKRYPPQFEKYTPTCKTNELEECSVEEIGNAYDNTILYTDYFLSKVIALLKDNDKRFETAMFYMSDHGQSLGENGIYLHGMPYFIAPRAQKHVASVFWFGERYQVDRQALRQRAGLPYSHDNVFHTLLGMLEIDTTVYNRKMDILANGN
ncbi:MAG: phosphoethanolamine--lipid A transferase [Desulfoprunum sp.]|nr:phosphoethanolamine--lipid A transferase [Desulfoprunum sp.]